LNTLTLNLMGDNLSEGNPKDSLATAPAQSGLRLLLLHGFRPSPGSRDLVLAKINRDMIRVPDRLFVLSPT